MKAEKTDKFSAVFSILSVFDGVNKSPFFKKEANIRLFCESIGHCSNRNESRSNSSKRVCVYLRGGGGVGAP